uniref:F-box domain-containing protein n=1 Tax=Oryza punctata TaxID=4537 RepID=A0A0E0MN35_ORYPU
MPETTTPPPPPAAVAADDTISSLTEDLLLIILGFLPAATDVVRTSALSTRWRHLWTLAPALRFDVGPRNLRLTDDAEAAADARLVAAVDSVLARRDVAGMPDVKDLVINFVYRSVVGGDEPTTGCSRSRFGTSRRRRLQRHLPLDITPASVAAWLRFAERRVAGAFSLDLPALSRNTRASLPSSEKLHSMRLKLGGATIGVPDAGDAYRSLADVLLSNVCLKDGDDVRLGNLLSSTSCPHLRRLELSAITGLTNLRLDATATLEELRLIGLRDMEQMEVDAPGLRELIVKGISKKHQAGIEDVIKDIPKLPNITDLRITVAMSTGTMDDTHAIGATITKLIAKFSRIEYLSIDIDKKAGDCTIFDCKCEQHKGWNNEMIPLEHLRMVDIRGFLHFNDQIELVCVLIASGPVLEKMIVALHESYEETRGRRNDMEAYLCIPSCGGRWTPCAWNGNKFGSATKYEWKPCKRKR